MAQADYVGDIPEHWPSQASSHGVRYAAHAWRTRFRLPTMQRGGEAVADIGHVHLKVSDLERAVGFYRDLVGMTLKNTREGAAFLAFGDYHHHLGLNTWRSRGGGSPAPETTGLYHFAVRYANRRDLAAALKRLLDAGVRIDSTSDCAGAADSIYLRDPDQNGLELTWDRPPETRLNPPPKEDHPLDLNELLGELG